MQQLTQGAGRRAGFALVPAILIVSGLAVFVVVLLTAVMSNARTVVHQREDYQVASAVESTAALAAEGLWSRYVADQGGAAGDIDSFRVFLDAQEIEDAGAGGLPEPTAGKDLMPGLGLPEDGGQARLNDVNLDAVRIVRRDVDDATQLFLTVSASTTRGEGIVNPVLNRAVQQVYTVEPADFPGFEYAMLANNVNCIFCHTRVDNAARWWNTDPDQIGNFGRVKVGTLESLMIRHNRDGNATVVNDSDADAFIAGTLYIRGLPTESSGALITAATWGQQSLMSHPFDLTSGNILEDDGSGLDLGPFSPADSATDPFQNLYLDYPLPYAEQGDGYLPDHFPAPFADDGGTDPVTGLFDSEAAGNKQVDDSEFLEVAEDAEGAITAGIVNLTPPGEVIDTVPDYANAVTTGNQPGGLHSATFGGQGVAGNVILTGYEDNPIWIDGTLAIDGDLVIQGYVKGSGAIYVRGNIYVPTDLVYADGQGYLPGDAPGSPTGPRTFGIASDGTKNALALTAGGNIMIGDFQRPAKLQADGTSQEPGTFEIVNGETTGKWNFPLAEMALFNRAEWAKTQPTLPGATGPVANPGYIEGYLPRYYGYGDDTTIPIFNLGATYFDPTSGTWHGLETPTAWDPSLLSFANPNNPGDPYLFNADGSPKAVTTSIEHTDGWMRPRVYKNSVEYFESTRPQGTPMQIDGLLYTNNAIFSIVYRDSAFAGMLLMNGSLVAADLGMLVPGKRDALNNFPNHSPISRFAIGLQLNYDERLKKTLRIKNPFQVQLKRTYWNPTANLL